jgi:penicillin V acylase-like amidase (Ntn superfamily)
MLVYTLRSDMKPKTHHIHPKQYPMRAQHSCSTFLLPTTATQLVGHNLDDYIDVPGLVVANPRGIAKENIGWQDLTGFRSQSRPRVRWASKYGSITYNTFGREFPDGGLNEAGLYGTKYPLGQGLPKIYHHQWMQYILDNFETVEQVLASLSNVIMDGHCQWHFFSADKQGYAAAIEFLGGETVIHIGEQMPVKVLCNTAYAEELAHLSDYEGFGGTKPVDFEDRKGKERLVQAAAMLQRYQTEPQLPPLDEAYAILEQLECGNTKWSIVYDLGQMRMYFRTYRASEIKHVDFSACNFSGAAPAMIRDIHQPGSGDVSGQFRAFNDADNRAVITEAWAQINMGSTFLNRFFKPILVRKLSSYPKRRST